MLKYTYIFQIKYTEAILSNITRKLLWFEFSKMLIAVKNKFTALFIIIIGTLSFRTGGDGHNVANKCGPTLTAIETVVVEQN